MKPIVSLPVAVVLVAGVVAIMAPVSGHADGEAKPVFVTAIPPGCRDWQFISVAHEEGNLNSFAAILGNDVAIKAYREKTLPFPNGAIIAALHFRHSSSEENNKVFGRSQSPVAGPPTNIQFMVKDSTKYAATGGWGSVTSTTANCGRGIHETLLPLSRASQTSRPGLRAVRTLNTVEKVWIADRRNHEYCDEGFWHRTRTTRTNRCRDRRERRHWLRNGAPSARGGSQGDSYRAQS